MEKIKKMFSSKSSRNGTYSVGLAVSWLQSPIVVNLVAGQLPEKVRNIDISSNNLYDISSVSTKMLKKLDKKVDLKVIAEQDSVDTRIKTFVKKICGAFRQSKSGMGGQRTASVRSSEI